MWTDQHQACLDAFAALFGLPALDSTAARTWTWNLAEQFAFSFPGEGWGTKQADPGRPQSTDCICTQSPFTGYDVIISQGSPDQHLAHYPEPINLTGQIYLAVQPVDHLGGNGPGGGAGYPPYPGDAAFDPLGEVLFADYAEAGHPPNPQMSCWYGRTIYDWLTGIESTLDASIAKHRGEWRSELGLPAAPG